MRTTLELNFVNHVFPSGGVTGISYFSLRLKNRDVTAAKVTAAHMLKLVLIFLSFEIMIILAVISLAVRGHMNNLILLIAGSLVTSLIILTLGFGFIIGSKRRIAGFFAYITRLVNALIRSVRPKHPEAINTQNVRRVFEDMHENYVRFSKDWRLLRWPFFWALMANFWATRWPQADGVYVFLLDRFMSRLDERMQQVRKPLVSIAFQVPGRSATDERSGVFLYDYSRADR